MSIGSVVALIVFASLASAGASACFFLMRELAISDDRASKLEDELKQTRKEFLCELRRSQLPLERVTQNLLDLESQRVESGRVRRVQISLADEYEALAEEDLADAA